LLAGLLRESLLLIFGTNISILDIQVQFYDYGKAQLTHLASFSF
jgi:hypothetical protein